MFIQKDSNLGFRIFKIPHDNGAFAGFHTMGLLTSGQSFCTEIALFNYALGPGGKFRNSFRDKGSWVSEVETSCAIGAGCHTEPASNAAMVVHQDNAIFPFKGGLRRAGLNTGGILAVVAGHKKG